MSGDFSPIRQNGKWNPFQMFKANAKFSSRWGE
jgi:hypothetical protein